MPTNALIASEDVAVLVRTAGLEPDAQQFEEIADAYPYVRAMVERLGQDFRHGDEPAHIFVRAAMTKNEDTVPKTAEQPE